MPRTFVKHVEFTAQRAISNACRVLNVISHEQDPGFNPSSIQKDPAREGRKSQHAVPRGPENPAVTDVWRTLFEGGEENQVARVALEIGGI